MTRDEYLMDPNKLVQFLQKPSNEFTKEDLIRYIAENGIKMINFRYVAEDGKLKTLNFIITGKSHLDSILSSGERVDGSSLFSYIGAGSSDLYVIPRFKTAFVNPFSEVPCLDILCSFYTAEGKPMESAPEYILKKAHESFKKTTGLTFKAMGELEYYIKSSNHTLYADVDQKGYHSSRPFTKWEGLRREAMVLIAQCGGKIKYGHSEVGNFSAGDDGYEQHEIEFLPVEAEDAVDQLVIAKWIVRMLAARENVLVSWAPKITVGKAGSGLHIHMLVEKDGKNICIENGKLSDTAKKMIAGILKLSGALTAFGNTIPTSYLRLVPHQEAPTYVCWGDRNRSVLVRVPLGWVGAADMIKSVNPFEPADARDFSSKQTFEFRVPDGSADIYSLVAGLIVAGQYGLEMEDGLQVADELYADVDIFASQYKEKLDGLKQLPTCCWESADCLLEQREVFERNGIFTKGRIDAVVKKLKLYEDYGLNDRILGNEVRIMEIVNDYIHCM
ncbi:glutamine synthetase [Labilibaculum sp. A4]|uniref:glutamine synthetase family protein n=1 Tax=Labilibaculum euxinus TaxID=2686357 RepID=UPI000F6162F5|nr:glutamine synthetase family protein [Labilibaculum euxinus]MDQ1772329.1 glutamine synthetase family protein [Labilibaculum euxinus]MWN77973.1 glutamine synthetase [Labilibaculum euxinus]